MTRSVARTAAGVLVGGFLVLLGVRSLAQRRSRPPTFRVLPVVRGDLVSGVSATGTVEPVEIVDVGAQIVGSVKYFGPDPDWPGKTIDYRSRVEVGTVLAGLDDRPCQAQLEKAEALVKIAQAELRRALARKSQADRDLRRSTNLGENCSAAVRDGHVAGAEMAAAEVVVAEARLEEAKVSQRQAEVDLEYATIRSPIDGVVIDRRVNVGQTVVAGLNAPSLFLLARNLGHLQVWAAVNEADIGDIRTGQRATFQVDAYRDRTFTGTVSQIRLNASLQQNVVTYGVVLAVENPDGKLFPYMTAKLNFEIARRSRVLLLPNQALRWGPVWEQITPAARSGITPPRAGGPADEAGEERRVVVDAPTVWVLAEDGLVRPVTVKTGLSDGIVTEMIEGGLGEGAQVVVNREAEAIPDFVSTFVTSVTRKRR